MTNRDVKIHNSETPSSKIYPVTSHFTHCNHSSSRCLIINGSNKVTIELKYIVRMSLKLSTYRGVLQLLLFFRWCRFFIEERHVPVGTPRRAIVLRQRRNLVLVEGVLTTAGILYYEVAAATLAGKKSLRKSSPL